ncbi:ABC transporter ATP-binding protein [Dethiosulfovibrio acidaminovorans]|uniref:ABC transporter ATP-binding protein n=2 Tax=Dethiosulfovibrio TaxID=47054 RepID=A0ABS9EP24_9BACT|nr:ABC transporter ATP-binding protein [Dethiosulfovibrio russensis]MCF4142271.1 ABC transporter ATP-binding protein [Dethiosulfovibrio marinus]MCF4144579.1 ABC transporter ATP-binding protein [Dethiosulfovibrio acidaminovorans]
MVDVRDLRKSYVLGSQEVHALQGVSFKVDRGEFAAIMGPSGSGKSTMMNMLGCLDVPTSGSYVLDGRDVAEMKPDELAHVRRDSIGFVFQGFNLLSRTSALENVELPMVYAGVSPSERHRRAAESLDLVGLGDRMDHMPHQMSGGQQQRVAIARALVNRAPLILADEPTGNLDSANSEEIMRLFRTLNDEQGITVILITHEPDMAVFARRVITFRDGRLVEDRRQES